MPNLPITVGEMKAALAKALPLLPHRMGVLAVAFSMERFRQQNWIGSSGVEPWKPRKKDSLKNKGKGILIQSGNLRRSIRITAETRDGVTVGSNIIYAKVHNEGSTETVQISAHKRTLGTIDITELNKAGKPKKKAVTTDVKAHSRKQNIPKRQFLGASPALTNQLTDMVAKTITEALKK
jgi:phage gpG-like protein